MIPVSQSPAIQSPTWSHAVVDSAGVLYSPREEDFRPRYEEDELNRAAQSWNEYWRWVRTFYGGNILARGCIRECEAILETVKEQGTFEDMAGGTTARAKTLNDLILRMNILCRLIAAEWSKDNGVRKIDTADVRRWRSRLRGAAGEISGKDISPLTGALIDIETNAIRWLTQ